jgi:hypothetical protein
MKRNQPVVLPLVAEYQGAEFQVKALKCASSGDELLYKIALPSALCTIPICWISGAGTEWDVVLGVLPDENLKAALIGAISKLEEVHTISHGKILSVKKSA